MSAQRSWSFQNTPIERSFLWSLAVTSLPVASGFFISWLIARWAGAEVLGTVSWVMSFATAILIVGKFGLDLSASRLASEYGMTSPGALRPLFRSSFYLRSFFTAACAIPSFFFAPQIAAALRDPSLVGAVRFGAFVVVCASVFEFQENFLIGLNRMQTVYKIRSIHLLLRTVFTAVLVSLGVGAARIIGGYCAAWGIAIAVYGVLLLRRLPPGDGSTVPDGMFKRMVGLSANLAVSSASVTIYSHMDRLMLGYFVGVEEVGQYAVARNIAEVTLFPVFAMAMVLRPSLAGRFSTGDLAGCAKIIQSSLRFSLLSGVLFGAIFAVLGVPLVVFVFSEQFRYAGELMALFVAVIVMRSVGTVILPALIAAERTRVYAYLTTISAVLNFVLSLVLIPRYHSQGVIAATMISYGILLVAGLREVFVAYRMPINLAGFSVAARTILAGVFSVAAIWLLIGHSALLWEAFLWAIVLSALYVFLVLAFRVSNLSDVRRLLINLRQSKG